MELTANHNIRQVVTVCSDFEKRNKLIDHLEQMANENAKVLIFVGTKRVADVSQCLTRDTSAKTDRIPDRTSLGSYAKMAGQLSQFMVTRSSVSVIGCSGNSKPDARRFLLPLMLPPVDSVCSLSIYQVLLRASGIQWQLRVISVCMRLTNCLACHCIPG